MGAEPYCYFFKYQQDINAALQTLRQREFEAGRYYPAMEELFEIYLFDENLPAPGAQHSSIEEARDDAAEEGTHSILDIDRVSDSPEVCATCALPTDELIRLLGTDKPTRALVESALLETSPEAQMSDDFWAEIGRGECRHIIVYDGEEPTEIFFAAYSFD